MELEGRIAVVTGASRRLGKAIALGLAGAGCELVVHFGSSQERAKETVEEIRNSGGKASCLGADLRVPAEVESLFARVDELHGGLDILVNSAASFEAGTLEQTTVDTWDEVQSLNLRAPFLFMQWAACGIRRRSNARDVAGLIVNISDLSGELPWRGRAAHGVSKAGLLHLSRIAAREMAPAIRVNAIVPGAILPAPGVSVDSEEWREIGARIPLGRPGHPDHIAETVLFMARNDFITGETIFVDGGERLEGAGRRPTEDAASEKKRSG